MKKMKNIFFMLLIAMMAMCSAVHAEPTAAPAADAQAVEATAAPEATAEPEEAPTPEPTVAPELTDNQVEAKEGATEVIFTISHKDTIDISIVSPSDVVLNTSSSNVTSKSVAGGTEVRIAEPEAGIWTMNASSMSGEAVTVKGECAYNFEIELQSESGVIYSGVSNKFIAFVKSKDGSKIDPDVLRTARMMINIYEEGSDKPKEVEMTFKGAAYEVTYTHNKVERISVQPVAVINNAEIKGNALDIICIVDPDQGGGFPIWVIILIVAALTGAGVYLYIKFADRIKSGAKGTDKNMMGNITINIAVNGDSKLPISRNLAMLGQSVGMLTVIGDDEYYDVDGITLSGADKGLKVVNKSRCDVRFSNAGADPNGVTILDNQYFKIFMPDEKTVITVTYHSDDIFANLVNTAAEQQKKMEENILAQQAAALTAEEIYKEFDNPEEVFDNQETTAEQNTAEQEAAAPVEEAAPALESLNLSEVSEDAVPEVQAEETEEVSDEAVEEMPAFTVDTSDAAPVEAPAEEEDYTPEAAPALESLDFSSLTEEAAPEAEAEEAAAEAEEVPEQTASFTIDTSDAVEITAPEEEDYTPEVAPALESFSFSFGEEQTADTEDTTAVDTAEAEDTVVIDEPEESVSSMFGDLASLANEVASSAGDDAVEAEQTGISFGDLASLAADAVAAETGADNDDSTVVMDSADDSEDLFNLQHLADELTKED